MWKQMRYNYLNSEVNVLLAKYGYKSQYKEEPISDPNSKLTFEEMMDLEEKKQKAILNREKQLRVGSCPVSFDPKNLKYSETKWDNVELNVDKFFWY